MKVPQQLPNFGRQVAQSLQVPLIDGQRQNQINQQVSAAITQLSMGLYSQVAAKTAEEPFSKDQLRQLARNCQTAAKCYFEGIGVLKIEEEQE